MADPQLHVDEERTQIVEQEDFMALVRAFRRAQGFALYFVECNVPAYRRDISDAVHDRLDRPVVDVHLGEVDRRSERPSIDSILSRQLEDAPEEAVVFVWELEWLLPTTEVDRDITQTTLREVNWRRGTYADLGRPLVVWLPEYAIRYLARNAPDFFDWNSGLYVFETPESDRPDLLETSLDLLDEEGIAKNLPTEEKRRHEAYLKSLLEEYSDDTDFDRSARIDLWLRLAELHRSRGNHDRARSRARQALGLSKVVENRGSRARSRHILGTIALNQGNYEEAKEEFEEVLRIRQQIGDRKGEASTRHDLATIALKRDNYGRAEKEFAKVLRARQQIGDRSGEATTRHNLASIALERGNYERAEDEFEKALRVFQRIGDRNGEATTRAQLATIALRQGNYAEAVEEFEEVLQIRQQIGDRDGEATTRHSLATIALEQGNYGKAEEEYEEVLQLRQQIGDRNGEATTRHQLATIALRQGDYAEARSKLEEVLETYQKIGNRKGEASTRHQLATIALERGNYGKAREEYEEALRIRQEIGDRKGEGTTLAQLGTLAADKLGRAREGLRLLHVGYDILTSIGHAQAEQVEPWIQGLVDVLGYNEDEWQKEAEYAQQSYAEDRGWNLIQEAFPGADLPAEVPSPE